MTLRPVRAALAATAAVVLLAGCGIEGTGDKGYNIDNGGVVEIAAQDRKPVDDVSGETLQGKKISLEELADGRPVVVNVWAPWCAPCRAEARDLTAAAKQLGDKAAFVGISIRSSSRDNPLAYERTYDIDYPSLWDPDGRSLLAFPSNAKIAATIPSTVVIDKNGKVSAAIHGPVPSVRTLVALVEDVS